MFAPNVERHHFMVIKQAAAINIVRQVAECGLPLETGWTFNRVEGRDLGAQPLGAYRLGSLSFKRVTDGK